MLTGNEILFVQGITPGGSVSPVSQQTTTGAIAGLSGNGITPDIVNTNITTVGAGTLTASALTGGLITRSGPVAAFTDTTDTAAAIVTAIGVFSLGGTFPVIYKNATAFPMTFAAGAGVTLPITNVLGPFQEASMYAVIGGTVAAPTVTFNHLNTGSISDPPNLSAPQSVALNTVGAGTVLAAAINAGIVTRGGTQIAAFTDTTDIAANIIAANPAIIGKIGASFTFTYSNNTTFPATLQGGTGVTVSVTTVAPPNAWVTYLVTYTAAATLTMVAIAQGHYAHSGTFVANGASAVTVANTAVTSSSTFTFGIGTIGGTPAGAPFIATQTPGTGFTVKAAAGDTSTYNYVIWS